MSHPIIDEFCRIGSPAQLQPINFRKFQRVFRDEVRPLLDDVVRITAERDLFAEENAALRGQVEGLRAQIALLQQPVLEPPKRKRGRPRKHPIPEVVEVSA